jgi:DNA-binding FrmR family transcriptional regulator
MDLQARIEAIKRDNDRKKEEKNRIEGKLDSLKQQMKEQFDCDDIKQLQDKIVALKAQIAEQEADITDRIEKMENYGK